MGKRCKVICDELLPLKEDNLVDYKVPNGGYFVWVKLDDIKANYLLEKSIPNKVKFHQGWKFTSNKKDFSDHMRISVSFYDEEDFRCLFPYHHKKGITNLDVLQGLSNLYLND